MSACYVYTIGRSRYMNLTDCCTLRCSFCPKFNGSHSVHDIDLSLQQVPTFDQIASQLGNLGEVDEYVFCGFGEPTLRLRMLIKLAEHLKARNQIVRLNTDGLGNLVHKRNILPELAPCIDRISVSMNAQEESVYVRHCRPGVPGSFSAMLDFLRMAPSYVKDVTATAIAGLEGVDIDRCEALARSLGVQFRARYLGVVG